MDPSTASEVVPPQNPEGDSSPGEASPPPDEDKLAVPPAVVLEEEESKEPLQQQQLQHCHQPKQQQPHHLGSDPASPVGSVEPGTEEEAPILPAGGALTSETSGSVPVKHDNNVVRFKDIQGYAEAKRDLAGVVELLKDPKATDAHAKKLGGKTPKGVVIFGKEAVIFVFIFCVRANQSL